MRRASPWLYRAVLAAVLGAGLLSSAPQTQPSRWGYGAVLVIIVAAGLVASIMLLSEPLPPPALVVVLATVTPTP